MQRRLIAGAFAAATWTLALATPALAHGDHDARPLARGLEAGPYSISLWQVYPDAGEAMTPHLIVMVDGGVAAAPGAEILVALNSTRRGEFGQRVLERRVIAQISGDLGRLARPGVTTSEGPATELAPDREIVG